ncbi:MAG: hypothetical protein LQ338_003686 [Usnochroma carphineum]|nr:MAG: hypothetical protein LQ338_003686 [Usnochroma carphineum]
MGHDKKRKSEHPKDESMKKKAKKQWRTPKKNFSYAPSINPGDAGIWATCDMHKEGLCTVELKDFFAEYARLIYGDAATSHASATESTQGVSDDIEAEINKEVRGIQDSTSKHDALFVPVKIDIQCVLFFKTREPVEPVSFVHRICEDTFNNKSLKRTRFVKRLTPMTRMGKANEKSLEEVAKAVLEPVFHGAGGRMWKITRRQFAIRPTTRNHHTMKRDDIIKRVADLVGKPHTVDLTHFDYLVLIDVYRNTLGMSVVSSDFEKLKRYNLAEIYEPDVRKPEC